MSFRWCRYEFVVFISNTVLIFPVRNGKDFFYILRNIIYGIQKKAISI